MMQQVQEATCFIIVTTNKSVLASGNTCLETYTAH